MNQDSSCDFGLFKGSVTFSHEFEGPGPYFAASGQSKLMQTASKNDKKKSITAANYWRSKANKLSKMSFLSKARISIVSLASVSVIYNPKKVDPPLSTFAKRPLKIDANEWNEGDFGIFATSVENSL